ncbi:MAG: protein-disulfide reductase DsbD [gamma proteobacterium symbiont of Taylorina sp.]|nr:protein-disulfide reductase DsbD [gamma proteobacterium symbiont of Taylorina sp.]
MHLQLILLLLLSMMSFSALAEEDFLPPEQAFAIQAGKIADDGQSLIVSWTIADDYYMYRDKISFTSQDDSLLLDDIKLSESETKIDPYFGEIQIYKNKITAEIPFSSTKKPGESFSVIAKSQGCASGGICYPPLKQTVSFIQPQLIQAKTTDIPVQNTSNSLKTLANLGNAVMPEDDFLDIEEAFKFSLSVDKSDPDKNQLSAIWSIADKHYLYKNKVKFELINSNGFSLDLAELPKGKEKNDEYLGDYEAYYKDLQINLPISGTGDTSKPLIVKASYQGCSESGICYPKVKKTIELDIASFVANQPVKPAAETPLIEKNDNNTIQSEQDVLAGVLSSENTFIALITFFFIGLGLAFTPCVFPMIPILSGIVAGQGEKAGNNAFMMSVVYVLSMAVVYTLVGVIAGLSGKNIQVIFQNPWVLSSFAFIFVMLSLSMFGFYNLQLPSSLQSRLSEFSNKQEGGTMIGVAIMGVLSALIVGPCMAPPLMGILLFIGQTGDPILGGSALFVMSLGMGVPLVIIGTSAGKLMPRAGIWMDTVKAVFGVSMLGVAIWMMERVLPGVVIMWLWAILLLASGIYMGALTPIHDNTTGWSRLWKSLGLVLMLYGSLLIIGASSGNDDYFQPLRSQFIYASGGNNEMPGAQHVSFEKIKSIADLDKKLALAKQQNKMLVLDFYADWCTYCKKMESTTFKSGKVISALQNFIVLQADVTAMDQEDEALLKAYKIPAPPAILFFKPQTGEAKNYRLVGYKNGDDFAQHVHLFLK